MWKWGDNNKSRVWKSWNQSALGARRFVFLPPPSAFAIPRLLFFSQLPERERQRRWTTPLTSDPPPPPPPPHLINTKSTFQSEPKKKANSLLPTIATYEFLFTQTLAPLFLFCFLRFTRFLPFSSPIFAFVDSYFVYSVASPLFAPTKIGRIRLIHVYICFQRCVLKPASDITC